MFTAPTTIAEFDALIPDERAAEEAFILHRWPDGICCPHCGSRAMTELSNRKQRWWQCRKCRKQTSIRSGTAMHASRKPLRDWLYAAWRCATPRLGCSTRRIAADRGYRYETMWVMVQKIRAALVERGIWQVTGPAWLGTAALPAPKLANGDPERRPPVVVAVAVVEDLPAPQTDIFRCEAAPVAGTTDDELLSATRDLHLEARAEAKVEPLRMQAPALARPPRPLADVYRCIRVWLGLQFGGVSRKYMPNYLAQFGYLENRGHTPEKVFSWMARRLVSEPWRPRSDVALSTVPAG